jgi:hypothetical protein
MTKELNIEASTVDKGVEIAKGFLSRLINPAAEEIGLLISENIRYLRFKNQVRILLKAKAYVEKKNISIKEIPIKILVPLLENASLEDSEELQDKWTGLLVNMIDSESNLQNQIFPYILSQISIGEFQELENLVVEEKEYDRLKSKFEALVVDDPSVSQTETNELLVEVNEREKAGFTFSLKGYEEENLVRLGLIRRLPPAINIYSTPSQFGSGRPLSTGQSSSTTASYDASEIGYRVTELGGLFVQVCILEKEKGSD